MKAGEITMAFFNAFHAANGFAILLTDQIQKCDWIFGFSRERFGCMGGFRVVVQAGVNHEEEVPPAKNTMLVDCGQRK